MDNNETDYNDLFSGYDESGQLAAQADDQVAVAQEPVAAAAVDAEADSLFAGYDEDGMAIAPTEHVPPGEDEVGFRAAPEPWYEEYITNPLQYGYQTAKGVVSQNLREMGITGQDEVEHATRQAEIRRRREAFAPGDEMETKMASLGDMSFGEAAKTLVTDPKLLAVVINQSLGTMAPTLATTAAAGMAAGPAGIAATFLGSGSTEYGLSFEDTMAKNNLDPSRAEDWAKMLRDKELMVEAREHGAKRGIAVGTFDAITAGLAGKLLAGAKKGILSPVSRAAGEVGVQAGGGGTGEAAAQLWSEGEISSPADIAMEMVAELPTAAVEAPGNIRRAKEAAAKEGQPPGFEGPMDEIEAQVPSPEEAAAQAAEELAFAEQDIANTEAQLSETKTVGAEVIAEAQEQARATAKEQGADSLEQELAAAEVTATYGAEIDNHVADLTRQMAESQAKYEETSRMQAQRESELQEAAAAPAVEEVVEPVVEAVAAPVEAATEVPVVEPVTKPEAEVEEETPAQRIERAAKEMSERANEAATSPLNQLPEPTAAQIEAGNYKKGHFKTNGLDITIENPAGSTRKAVDGSWEMEMKDNYGYIKGTQSAEGATEQLDVFVGESLDSKNVYVIDQYAADGTSFDEHKVMVGYPNAVAARRAYAQNYPEDTKIGPISAFTTDKFKTWLDTGDQTVPVQPDKFARVQPTKPATAEHLKEVIQTDTRKGGEHPRTLFRAGEEGRRSAAREVDVERRSAERREQWTYRKEVDAMTPAEQKAVIAELRRTSRQNKLTGLPDRQAWEKAALPEAVKKGEWIASVDADSLGWVNDNIGNQAGDQLLVEVANALKKEFGEEVFHISGDEFWAHGADKASLEKRLTAAQEALKSAAVDYKGNRVEGLAFSWGLSKNAVQADREMKADKKRREAAGERVSKTTRPGGVTLTSDTAVDEKTEGRRFKDFFSGITKGLAGKSSTGKEYSPVIGSVAESLKDEGSATAKFAQEYSKHRGNFDDHIAFSIPGFKETQVAVGAALGKTLGKDKVVLDIGASEGSLMKAVSAQSGARTLSLDPNLDMQSTFEKTKVPGAEYSLSALGTAEQEGNKAWDEGDTPINYFDPKGQRFDVIHEAMVFQFISPDRAGQISRIKELLTKDGVAIIEEKMFTDQQSANEAKKNDYKRQYFHQKEMTKKAAEVLEGMDENTVHQQILEEVLTSNFDNVIQFWDSGNFKGYVVSDNALAAAKMANAIGDTQSEFSTTETPRKVTAPSEIDAKNAARTVDVEITEGVDTADFTEAHAAVGNLNEKFPGVSAITLKSTKDAPSEIQTLLEEKDAMGARALYDVLTDEVYVFTDNHSSISDVVKSVLHEGLAHKGLRTVFGSNLPGVLNSVAEGAGTSQMARVAKKYGFDLTNSTERQIVAEELIAEAAEGDIEASWFQRVVDLTRQLLRDAGIVHQWTDSDIKALLRKTRAGVRGSKPLSRISINEEFNVEGEVVAVSAPATQILRRLDKRIEMCKKLKGCI